MSNLLETTIWTYGPGVTALFAALLFAFADPVHEVLLVLAQDTLSISIGIFRVLLSSIGIVLMTCAIWHASRYVLINSPRGKELYFFNGEQYSSEKRIDKDLSWTPHVLASLPVLGLIVGVLKTAVSGEADDGERKILYGFFVFLIMLSSTVLSSSTWRDEPKKESILVPAIRVLFFALLFAGFAWLIGKISGGKPWGIILIVFVSLYYLVANYLSIIVLDNLRQKQTDISIRDIQKEFSGAFVIILVFVISITFFLAIFFGLPEDDELSLSQAVVIALTKELDLIYSCAIGFAVFLGLFKSETRRLNKDNKKNRTGRGRFFGIGALIVTIGAYVVTICWPMIWNFGGPVFVGSLFFGALALNSAWLTVVSAKRLYGLQIPLVLVVLMMFFGKLGVTSNHRIQGVRSHDPVASYQSAAEDWLGNEENGPIYLVAAQGGGLYAGYHAAYDLALRSDNDRKFRSQVFAISGVSGGAVGAAVYWALAHCAVEAEHPKKTCSLAGTDNPSGSYARAVKNALEQDFLTPVTASLLFPDFANELIPYASTATNFERGIALSKGIQNGIARATNYNIGQKFAGSIHATAIPGTPILLINSTRLDDGAPMVFSPIKNTLQELETDSNRGDLALADAVVASARFPIVTPASRAYIKGDTRGPSQLIDGGYYDNSGLEGLRPALDAMIAANGGGREIRVLMYRIEAKQPKRRSNFGTLTSPIVGLNSTRSSRNDVAIRAFYREYANKKNVKIYDCIINTGDFDLTLSWLLSSTTFKTLENAIKLLHVQHNRDDIFCPKFGNK